MFSANRVSSFPTHMPFFSFLFYIFCLTALPGTSSIMLNRSGRSGYACLFPGLKGKAFSLSLLSMMLVISLLIYVY